MERSKRNQTNAGAAAARNPGIRATAGPLPAARGWDVRAAAQVVRATADGIVNLAAARQAAPAR